MLPAVIKVKFQQKNLGTFVQPPFRHICVFDCINPSLPSYYRVSYIYIYIYLKYKRPNCTQSM